jgi:hypothetical protein
MLVSYTVYLYWQTLKIKNLYQAFSTLILLGF